jgi:hypothetical protein
MTAPGSGPSVGDVDIEGDASQNAVGNQVNGDLVQKMTKFVRGIPSWYLSCEEITDRVASYVPALNHDLVEKALETNRALFLIGPAGCGRETTAIAAISHLRPGIPIRRFSLNLEDTEEIDVKGTCGYLVRAADGLGRLGWCVEAVHANDGYLVVIGDNEADQKRTTLPLPCIPIEPPHPVQVYRHRLRRQGLRQWLTWDLASALLEDALPSDSRRLVDLIEQADRRGIDLAEQQEEVAKEYEGWRDELRDWFDDHPEPHQRALLLAAASLVPAAEETDVYAAASSLARRLEITLNGGGLVWWPVTRLRDLLMAVPGEDRIAFRRHGYAESALLHTLMDYPLARSDVISWLADLTTDGSVAYREPESLAATFAKLAAEHGLAGHITEASSRWGNDGHADLAFIALSRTCLHPLVGGRVRGALYDWSRTPRLPQTLKLTIARVCEPLGQTYPSIALTRLKHLATYGNAQVVHEVISAALGLVETGNGRDVLMAALGWSAESNFERLSARARKRRIRAGAMLFLELAGRISPSGLPEVLDGKGAVDPLECSTGWRAALYARATVSDGRETAFDEPVHRWLDAALLAPRLRGRITDAFVNAAMPPAVPLGYASALGPVGVGPVAAKTMIDVVRRWAAANPTNPNRRKIKEEIVIPLTSPWWLRFLKMFHVWVRTLVSTILQPD